jgi:hypothetical protein
LPSRISRAWRAAQRQRTAQRITENAASWPSKKFGLGQTCPEDASYFPEARRAGTKPLQPGIVSNAENTSLREQGEGCSSLIVAETFIRRRV